MRRVVVTGMGVVSSAGSTISEFWDSCLRGRSRVASIPTHWQSFGDYKSTIWSPLPRIEDPDIHRLDWLHYDPVSIIAFIAARDALRSAGFSLIRHRNSWIVEDLNRERSGVYMGTGLGGGSSFLSNFSYHALSRTKKILAGAKTDSNSKQTNEVIENVEERILFPKRFSPFAVSLLMQNAVSAAIGVKFSLLGPNNTVSVACASGTVALGSAYEAVRNGTVDLVVTGGSEYVVDDYGAMFRGYDAAGTLVHGYDHPETANRPFDKDRSGFLYSQGGCGVLIVEEYDHAKNRKAPILAEIIGFGQTFDAHNMMSIEINGYQIERMIRNVVKSAGISLSEVDYINAHGTGTLNNDKVESDVVGRMFTHPVWINTTKSILGHTLGASGAIEAIVTVLTLINQTTHMCVNLENPITNLNFVRNPNESIKANIAMSQSFAFGGHNAALILKRVV